MKLSEEMRLRLKFTLDAINDCVDANREVKIEFYKRAIGHLQDIISELEKPIKMNSKQKETTT